MKEPQLLPLPTRCPVTAEEIYITEITSADSGVTVRGRFAVPGTAHLTAEQQELLQVFLRARGVIATMERELNLSYPTVRARVDALIESMGLTPYRERGEGHRRTSEEHAAEKRRILQALEEGTITAAEAKAQLKELDR